MPREIIIDILARLDALDIMALCSTSADMRRICRGAEYQPYWRQLWRHRFGGAYMSLSDFNTKNAVEYDSWFDVYATYDILDWAITTAADEILVADVGDWDDYFGPPIIVPEESDLWYYIIDHPALPRDRVMAAYVLLQVGIQLRILSVVDYAVNTMRMLYRIGHLESLLERPTLLRHIEVANEMNEHDIAAIIKDLTDELSEDE